MNIYELPKEIEEALEKYYSCFNPETGEQIVEDEELKKIDKELFELQNTKEELLEWYLKDRINKKADNIWIQAEIARLQERVLVNNKKIERVENIIDYNFKEDYKWKPIHFWNFTIAYKKSTKTIIEDENKIPSKFKIKQVVTTIKIPKKEIKEALDKWEKVPWAKLENSLNLNIK